MCTLEKRGRVYLLTLTGEGEHRLNPTLLDAIGSALAQVRSDYASEGAAGAALVTAAEGKFFSNGFDLAWAKVSPADRPQLMSAGLRRTVADMLSLPMPTIAAVTGHASAAGCLLALSHDYVVMRSDRGFLYMSELEVGMSIPRYFIALLRAKICDPRVLRGVLLRSAKMTAPEAVKWGIVDRAVDGVERTVEEAVRMGEELAAKKWDVTAYASIRRATFSEACREMGLADESDEEVQKVFASKL